LSGKAAALAETWAPWALSRRRPKAKAMVRANGIEICYQSLGDPGAPVILLIMGLGMQLVAWPDAFCASLVERGFRVIRFDNRDVGHSTRVVWGQRPRVLLAVARGVLGLPVRSPYRLSDMADDAIGLLDALQVERAHVVGASMGGMIARAWRRVTRSAC
jgi:pimeloyl-ACP methyl ester carboxylesterase